MGMRHLSEQNAKPNETLDNASFELFVTSTFISR